MRHSGPEPRVSRAGHDSPAVPAQSVEGQGVGAAGGADPQHVLTRARRIWTLIEIEQQARAARSAYQHGRAGTYCHKIERIRELVGRLP